MSFVRHYLAVLVATLILINLVRAERRLAAGAISADPSHVNAVRRALRLASGAAMAWLLTMAYLRRDGDYGDPFFVLYDPTSVWSQLGGALFFGLCLTELVLLWRGETIERMIAFGFFGGSRPRADAFRVGATVAILAAAIFVAGLLLRFWPPFTPPRLAA